MNKLFLIFLTFLDFLPLWIIVMFLDGKALFYDHVVCRGAEWCGLVGCGCGVLVAAIVVWLGVLEKKQDRETIQIVKVKENKKLTSEVLLSYVLPLLAFNFGTWVGLVQFLVFFICIVLLNLRSNSITANVVFGLIGYRFYETEFNNGANGTLMSKRYLVSEVGTTINVVKLNDNIAIEVKSK